MRQLTIKLLKLLVYVKVGGYDKGYLIKNKNHG